jgi:hypothetical protein
MSGGEDPQLDAFAVDVRELLARNVANLYSHLITRPTGRAVRMAIEAQLAELRRPALSIIDFSSVAILDYSCADEVVAKLLLQGQQRSAPARGLEAFFVFRGIDERHMDPVLEVLGRHGLAAVTEPLGNVAFELMGETTNEERTIWQAVEEAGRVHESELPVPPPGSGSEGVVLRLARRGLVFHHPVRGEVHALSRLVRGVG